MSGFIGRLACGSPESRPMAGYAFVLTGGTEPFDAPNDSWEIEVYDPTEEGLYFERLGSRKIDGTDCAVWFDGLRYVAQTRRGVS